MKTKPESVSEAMERAYRVRDGVAGGGAKALGEAASVLFEAGGKSVLPGGVRQALRESAELAANRSLGEGAGKLLAQSANKLTASATREGATLARGAPGGLARAASSEVGKAAAGAAVRAVLKGVGKAASIGFVIDGGVAGFVATNAYLRGEMTGGQAARLVVKEASTGAIAAGMGVLLGAGLVALTGPISGPLLFLIGATGSAATKSLLLRMWGGPRLQEP